MTGKAVSDCSAGSDFWAAVYLRGWTISPILLHCYYHYSSYTTILYMHSYCCLLSYYHLSLLRVFTAPTSVLNIYSKALISFLAYI